MSTVMSDLGQIFQQVKAAKLLCLKLLVYIKSKSPTIYAKQCPAY